MKLCKVLTGFGFVLLCLAAPAVAGQPVAAVAPAAQSADLSPLPVGCGSVLPQKSQQAEICPAAQPAAVLAKPDFLFESKKLGYCHCGCSSTPTCRTSADCGGASCDAFISCC